MRFFCTLHQGHFLTDKQERLGDKRTLGGAMAPMGSDDDGQNTALMKTTESPSDASLSIVCVLPKYSAESPIERLSKKSCIKQSMTNLVSSDLLTHRML